MPPNMVALIKNPETNELIITIPEVLVFVEYFPFFLLKRLGNFVDFKDLKFSAAVSLASFRIIGPIRIRVACNGSELAIAFGNHTIRRYSSLDHIIHSRLCPSLRKIQIVFNIVN